MVAGRWYEDNVLPRIITLGCSLHGLDEMRSQVVPLAEGRVLEIGCGGGFNMRFYDPDRLTSYTGIDPNGALLDKARDKARSLRVETEIVEGTAESLPFADTSFETVVCTYTLCSVQDPAQAMAEMRRVLKPRGRLLFLEHGKAPDNGPQRWQRRIEPVWKRVVGNCHLSREIGTALRRAGFEVEPLGQKYYDGSPKWAGWMEWGKARRAGA